MEGKEMSAKKFRKRPIVIEAIQLSWQTWNEVCDFFGDDNPAFGGGCYLSETGEAIDNPPLQKDGDIPPIALKINTLEGQMIAKAGDWIIKGVAGEFYPCKPEIFDQTYEEQK